MQKAEADASQAGARCAGKGLSAPEAILSYIITPQYISTWVANIVFSTETDLRVRLPSRLLSCLLTLERLRRLSCVQRRHSTGRGGGVNYGRDEGQHPA